MSDVDTSNLFSGKRNRVVYGHGTRLTLLQALMAGAVPNSVVKSADSFLGSSHREWNDWPQWKKDAANR